MKDVLRRMVLISIVALCVQTLLWAESSTPDGEVIELLDARGKSVRLHGLPGRIVVAGRGAIPIVDAAYLFPEAEKKLFSMVSCDQGKGSFAAVLDEDFLETAFADHNIGPEDVISLKPDCVLMKSYMAGSLGAPLENLGIPVVCVDFESPEQFRRDVGILGTLFGNRSRAEELLDWYEEQSAAVFSALADRDTSGDPRVLFIYHSTRGGNITFNVPPAGWLQTQLILNAGGIPVWTTDVVGKGWMKVGIEQVARWDPDIIFLTDYFNPVDTVKEELLADPAWKQLRAAREGRLYAFPADYYSWDQPDTRWILALEWTAAVLHPDKAPSFSARREVTDFFGFLYRMDRETIEENIFSRFQGDTDL